MPMPWRFRSPTRVVPAQHHPKDRLPNYTTNSDNRAGRGAIPALLIFSRDPAVRVVAGSYFMPRAVKKPVIDNESQSTDSVGFNQAMLK